MPSRASPGSDDDLSPSASPPSTTPAPQSRSVSGAKRKRDGTIGRELLLRDINENTEEYLQSGSRGINETIEKANEYLRKVRRPGEAASDSRLLVSTTDLSYRKTLRLTQGSLSQGVDVDEFVSKCITYMRQGRGIQDDDAPELSSTQRHRRRSERPRDAAGGVAAVDDDDGDVGDEGDMMNWSHLGRFAALPYIRRPGLPGFMLGPLSVEKKARRITKRSAPFRPDNLAETKPEVLNVADFAKKENDLTAICVQILQQLRSVQADVQETVADLIDDDMDDEARLDVMHRHGLRSTGGIDVMRFVVNPKSFGQTVENMFYGASKHQAIMSMDMDTWQDIIDTFDLADEEPMIEHRREAKSDGPGARGWYS
ncbi:Pfam:Nse4 [Geosmithia morbida]|uniref:Non-structural maintenance of chromosomes element 4 n=1 Tax=Geosmithia morbida TaxID=1094350 RepID=A0A9P5D6F4_9HYPO|nr:Pfam:Nse4 [Geosmithia morbida]KAF4124700.1 Pfam:Nse4 [Geosmithia morbida]